MAGVKLTVNDSGSAYLSLGSSEVRDSVLLDDIEEAGSIPALGALAHSPASLAVAVTGIAGPGGATPDKPVGLVHLAAAARCGRVLTREQRLGNIGRAKVRVATVERALALLRELATAV